VIKGGIDFSILVWRYISSIGSWDEGDALLREGVSEYIVSKQAEWTYGGSRLQTNNQIFGMGTKSGALNMTTISAYACIVEFSGVVSYQLSYFRRGMGATRWDVIRGTRYNKRLVGALRGKNKARVPSRKRRIRREFQVEREEWRVRMSLRAKLK
jgi:hypothetical protein